MACFHPLTAYKLENGQISFNEKGKILQELSLPCGGCIGCRLERSRSWAIRCIHEAALHTENCFITLTYDEEHHEPSLYYPHFQKFLRSLRKATKKKIRFYMCGEYGDLNGRPHFHACLFGYRPKDLEIFKQSSPGEYIYTSATLQKHWPYGYSSVGNVTLESAAYIARYIFKKQTGKNASDHYQACDSRTGELTPISPEFNRMSLKPGIGMPWLQKYQSDIYPIGTLIHDGIKMKPPKYYDKYFKKLNPDQHEELIHGRLINFNYEDNTVPRLSDREQYTKAKLTHKKRGFK